MRKILLSLTMAVVMMFSGIGCDLFANEQCPVLLKHRPVLDYDLYRKKAWYLETVADTTTITKITINGEEFIPKSEKLPKTLNHKQTFPLGFNFVPHEITVTTDTGRTWVFRPDLD